MRFLADQDVYAVTVGFLRNLGHEVITANEIGMSRTSDKDLLREACRRECVFVTRDKDFGTLAFLASEPSLGIFLLRMAPTTMQECHIELKRVLSMYSEADLRGSFWVIEPDRHRRRRFSHS